MATSSSKHRNLRRQHQLADQHWRAADFDLAEDALQSIPSNDRDPKARLLLGRLITKGDPSKGAAYFETLLQTRLDDATKCVALTYLGYAYARAHDYRKAEARFKTAELVSSRSTCGILSYYRAAARFFQQREDKEILTDLDLARDFGDDDTRAMSLLLRAGLEARNERYRQQIPHLLEALKLLKREEEPNVELLAFTLENIAVLVRETYEPTLANLLEEELENLRWTASVGNQLFVVSKAIGWWKALNGDYFNAFRFLKRSSAAAPTQAWRVVAKADLAYLARCIGEPHWSLQELHEALELSEKVQWESESGESVVGLLLLAELYAPIDTAMAVQCLSQYRTLEGHLAPAVFGKHDRRLQALAEYASALLEWRLGNRSEAATMLQNVYDIYAAIGFDWRAGRAATDLAMITGDSLWARRARQSLAHYQRSWLFKNIPTDLTIPNESGSLRQITPAQRRVFDLILLGWSDAKIAQELGRSKFTVKNHVKAILEAFQVASRSELAAKARAL